jgi:hypothetical protein
MKTIVMAVLALTVILSFAAAPMVVAHAMSCDGAIHGAFANVNGNFGFLGAAGGTPGYHGGAVGQDPGATGYNNSTASASCN